VIKTYFGKADGEHVINDADDLCMYLLNVAHVSTVTGRAFGEPECIRISFANSMEKLEQAMDRISRAMSRLK
jgi:aspartate aminotransferase